MLGWRLMSHFRDRGYRVTGTYVQNRPPASAGSFLELDLENRDLIGETISKVKPEAVVHSAAMTRPDECEEEKEKAYRVNVEATAAIAEALGPDVTLVYISTDLVFDGEKGWYKEEDLPNPVNYYGESKLLAEETVRSRNHSVVCRVAKLYAGGSPFHPCFVTWMRDRFESGQPVPLFSDQFRTPVFVDDVARALEAILEQGARKSLYHVAGPRRLTRLEFGKVFAQVFGYDEELIKPTRLSELDLTPRGKDCSLDSSLFRKDYDFEPTELEEGLGQLCRQMT